MFQLLISVYISATKIFLRKIRFEFVKRYIVDAPLYTPNEGEPL